VTLSIRPSVPVKARIVYIGGTIPENAASIRPELRAKENYSSPFEAVFVTGTLLRTPDGRTIMTTGDESTAIRDHPDATVVSSSVGVTRPSKGPTTDAAGVTTFPDVPEARYTFTVNGLPPNAFVSDIRQGDKSIFDSGLFVGPTPPDEVQIIVSLADIVVTGSVLDALQKPVGFAKVVLVPEVARRGNTALYRTGYANGTGNFQIHGVPPGQYKVFAWENSPPNFAWQNTEFISKYEQLGQTVLVSPEGTNALRIVAIP
jgi:hypothetical protein